MTEPERDYSETLFLPKTDFPMRAGLPQKEPALLERWKEIGIYKRLREAAHGRPKFTLHDGPPYANGNIHIGTALNKILKDLVTRSQQMLGYDSNYVPGWDCHGLPIEWRVEEENYRSKNKKKPDLSDPDAMIAFRRECRAYAEHWLNVQREEFKRLGVEGDWDHPYTTMSFPAEAQIAREIMKFAQNGTLYRGSKPVMWSVVEKTALAEAEVEYEDYTSDQVWVKFPVQQALDDLMDASVVIWTTTPWTIPGNRAISFSSNILYGLYEVLDAPEGNWAKRGDKLIMAQSLAHEVLQTAKVLAYKLLRDIPWTEIPLYCSHPLATFNAGYRFKVPLLSGSHVTDDTGTGFVHTAPGHGREDFDVWTANATKLAARGINTTIPYTVDENGAFTEQAPGFTGKRVLNDKGEKGDANEAVIKALIDAGMLIARSRLKHQYPHSWRSKKAVIFRNTPQWFIAMGDQPQSPGTYYPFEGDPVLKLVNAPWDKPKKSRFELPNKGAATRNKHPSKPIKTTPSQRRELAKHFVRILEEDPKARISNVVYDRHRTWSVSKGSLIRARLLLKKKSVPSLRQRALAAIAATRWVPPQGENRITGMIESRPDWVISRQRAWGVPITVFVRENSDGSVEILKDERVNKRIADAFEQEGADAWYANGAAARFLKPDYDSNEWHKVDDILDVWFDSGSTHAFVLGDPKHFPSLAGIKRKKDGGADTVMYLEGSDQHRGWFQSSLLESCGTRGVAPFDVVVTHGFTLDEHGRKMSKSLGNTIAPQDVIKQSGADILRLWVASSDYWDDQRIGPEILKTMTENYRKLRNTLRWMLGSLAHFHDGDRVAFKQMPELERLMLHRLAELGPQLQRDYADFDYKRIVAALNAFMTTDLSSFYFDIRKDTLYCDPISSQKRRACLTVLDHLFRATVTWLAPILPFTAEEAWLARDPSEDGSVHLQLFPDIPAEWRDDALAEKWRKIRIVRRVVTGAIEIERAGKRIGSSLEADPLVHVSDPDLFAAVVDVDLAEVCITSAATLVSDQGPAGAFRLPDVNGVAVVVKFAEGRKCARSWKISPAVGSEPDYPDVTPRDAQALREWHVMRTRAAGQGG